MFPAGEEHKNLDTVRDVYRFLIEEGFDRKDMLLALGGGVCGDLTGFVAATYLRGIDFVQIQLHCWHRQTALLAVRQVWILTAIRTW